MTFFNGGGGCISTTVLFVGTRYKFQNFEILLTGWLNYTLGGSTIVPYIQVIFTTTADWCYGKVMANGARAPLTEPRHGRHLLFCTCDFSV